MESDNLKRFENPANEGSTALVQITFKDELGVDANPDTATYTLYNRATGAVINSRTAVSITGSTATRTITLTPADNAIIDTTLQLEEHRIFITFTYGGGKTGTAEIQIVVVNLAKVS